MSSQQQGFQNPVIESPRGPKGPEAMPTTAPDVSHLHAIAAIQKILLPFSYKKTEEILAGIGAIHGYRVARIPAPGAALAQQQQLQPTGKVAEPRRRASARRPRKEPPPPNPVNQKPEMVELRNELKEVIANLKATPESSDSKAAYEARRLAILGKMKELRLSFRSQTAAKDE
jgi:hypothetical protein